MVGQWFNGPFNVRRDNAPVIHIYPIPPMNGFKFTTEKVFFLDRCNSCGYNEVKKEIKDKNGKENKKPWLR